MSLIRASLLFAAVALVAAPPYQAQTPGKGPATQDLLISQVRTALGRGRAADARSAVETATAPPIAKEFATALIEIFEGKDDAARARLQPLADRGNNPDATLELALIHMRTGRRADAERMLAPLVAVRTFNGPDDYFRLARAALPVGEYLLAKDAYMEIESAKRADIQTGFGDLFLAKHAYGEAVTSYKLALAADPGWIAAHLGMSRAVFFEDPKDAAEMLETARKLAPEHPDVWVLTAERALFEDDIAAAKAALDKVAQFRPGTVDEAALRGASAYIEGRTADIDAAIARVAAIDPLSAQGWRSLGEAAALKYRFDDAAEFAKKAVALDPADQRAHADLGLYALRTGDEALARTELETAFKLDRSDVVTFNLLGMLDKLEKFDVVEQAPFVFKFPSAEAGALGAYALPLADEAFKQFQARYAFQPKGPILVEIFSVHDDFAVRTVGLMGLTGALGACFGRVVSMDSPRARPPGDFSWQATLWHELAHVFSLQLSDYRVPRWLTEGISVFEEHRRQPAWGRELTLEFAAALSRGRTFGVKGLPSAFKRVESLAMAYFEASLLVEHLVELHGDAGLRTLLLAYKDRATDAEAFAKAFGRSVDDIDASFKAFVAKRYGDLAKAMAEPSARPNPDDLAALRKLGESSPGSFIVQLTLGQTLFKLGDIPGAKAALERAAELAPQATGDTSPRALLALIAEREGDQTRKRRELRTLLVHDHTNIEAARELALLASAAKATDDEDYALRLVADLDPFDSQIHGALGRRLMAKGDYAAALIEFKAAVAVGPPNLAEAHTDVAEAAMKLGRNDEARKAALAALDKAPTYTRAQDILLAVRVKK
jgi:tetratricopeptide (TPR) repeat protein